MHHRLQSGKRENPASHRRHGSRFEVDSLSNRTRTENASVASRFSEKVPQGFEPLIGSCDAAKLLGNIHVKTLQRYARHGRIPGYQIGGHWYFRASELDSWLRSQINSNLPTR